MANIQLTHVHPQESFKLLEFSPELLDLLSSSSSQEEEGQKKPKLYLKSPASLPEENSSALPLPAGSPANEMFVNLCTDDRTFFLRQVSSSNSTLMIRPRRRVKTAADGGDIMEEGDDYGEDEKAQADECSIVASCKGQLEVLSAPGWYDGKPFLTKALKVWELDNDDDEKKDK
ncbi:hypothetical protein KEM56_003154, partial [Ascosphaera pollenicola]